MKPILLFSLLISGSLYAQILDYSFGNNGFTTVQGTTLIRKTLLTPDQKIISVGYTDINPAFVESATLTMHDLNGVIDQSFGTNGVVQLHINYACKAVNAALQEDGKILVIGSTYLDQAGLDDCDDHAFISRLHSNGELDSGFAINGSLTLGSFETFNTVFVNPDHSILISGNTYNGAMLFRLNEDGTADTDFGVDGMKELFADGYSFYNYAAIKLADGTILSVGTEGYTQISCQKLNSEGELITSFGENGHFVYPVPNNSSYPEYLQQAVERPDGKIVLLGQSDDNLIALINADGSIDQTFGTNGIIVFPDYFTQRSILVQEDNKILFGGSGVAGFGDLDVYFSRYTASGQLDPMFSSDGHMTLEITGWVDDMQTMTFLNNSRLLLAGRGSTPEDFGQYGFLLSVFDISQSLSAEELSESDFSIYPNPAENVLFIKGYSPQRVRILNASGQLVREVPYDLKNGISLEKLDSGSYLVTFEDEKGRIVSKTFVHH